MGGGAVAPSALANPSPPPPFPQYWRPYNDTNFSPTHFPDLAAGHFTPIDDNLNALAGFVRYMPWDSVRVEVKESEQHGDYRTLAYLFDPAAALWLHGVEGRTHYTGPRAGRDAAARAAATHLGFALTNRGNATSFNYNIALLGMSVPPAGTAPVFAGFAFSPSQRDVALGNVTARLDAWGHWALEVAVQPLQIQFWVQQS